MRYSTPVVAALPLLLAVCASTPGCAKGRPESVPADARSVAKQTGTNPVNFTAPRDGTVYVYDRSAKKMLYSGRVHQGETLELDPKRNAIRLEGKVVMQKDLRDLNQYQVWFDEKPTAPATAVPASAAPMSAAPMSAAPTTSVPRTAVPATAAPAGTPPQ